MCKRRVVRSAEGRVSLFGLFSNGKKKAGVLTSFSSSSNPSLALPLVRKMDSVELGKEMKDLKLKDGSVNSDHFSGENQVAENDDGGLQITCITEVLNDASFHFQIIRFPKQVYVWIGYNSAKFGHMYATAATRPNNMVSVTSILGGASDNIGSGIARRLVSKTGLNIILSCNIPKYNPMIEVDAEKILIQKLINLGYTKTRLEAASL